MYRLSSIVTLILLGYITAGGQSPHGKDFTIDCAKCHSPESWSFNSKTNTFNHDSTSFPLTGQHVDLDCRSCHTSPVFNEVKSECISCHADIHQQTVGSDCARCHTPQSWIVENITGLHEQISFPLMGVHATVNCNECHQSETNVRFSPTGTECVNCHLDEYNAAKMPDHIKLGFGNDCTACHSLTGTEWNTEMVDHSFFPLEQGHMISDCAACHKSENYADLSPVCVSCHQTDFNNTLNPNHSIAGFSTDCVSCHTISSGWKPVTFATHDVQHFPIYSGKHQGVWNDCVECHTNSSDYTQFTCVSCHKNPETNDVHQNISGYVYDNNACLACHPSGDAENAFNHNATNFPLTGAHTTVECISCHADGFVGTSTLCVDCHLTDFNQTVNPNHIQLGLSSDCASCHSTSPGWNPASFVNHDEYYKLQGAHAAISNDCVVCHHGDYNNTSNQCIVCHTTDFNSTTNPNHVSLQFSTDCISCHSENSWIPSTFNHDGQHFPINSGKHLGTWNQCLDCHNNPANYSQFTCITCHQNPETNEQHPGVSGYVYSSSACLACHPTGDADNIFDHNTTTFPLTGAHIGVECTSCHSSGFEGTSVLCVDCHTSDFNTSLNPNHPAIGISTDCASCHTTAPGWSPATFANHNDYYLITGAHTDIANDCVACHNGNYNNTPNTCIGCHTADFNNTTNPDHEVAMFPTDCTTCHSQSAWTPSTFNHSTIYPLTGAHATIANNCVECHANGYNNTPNTCVGCHQSDFNTSGNPNHPTIGISTDCVSCHTTAPGWSPATFANHNDYYLITGAHTAIAADCAACHNGNYNITPNTCVGCHAADFNNTTDPDHEAQQFPTDCISCHSQSAWAPSTFNHNTVYPLIGAHAAITNNCVVCHNGNYTNTPNTCIGCHTADFNNTTNPDHEVAMFPTDCTTCHSQSAWAPTTFNHNTIYPLTGAHATIANNCVECHANGYNNTPNTCVGCHQSDFNTSGNPNHPAIGISTDCALCHTTTPGWSPASFPVHNEFYMLNGAHAAISSDCIICHNGNYNNTPTTCVGCHNDDYIATTDPNHITLQFPADCATCHSESSWNPSTFNHDGQYFPINSGKHLGTWNQCLDCHNNPANYSQFTCITCHQNPETNEQHPGVSGYVYSSSACLACHPTGDADNIFDHNTTTFPLTGAHIGVECTSCHSTGFEGTSVLCVDCHTTDFNQSLNPNHPAIGISTDCATCHTTAPGWSPATFANHNDYYLITGAHTAIAADCVACHNGNYNNTPNTCIGCHTADFNNTTNPDHEVAMFPTDCTTCHSQSAWTPSTFNHSTVYPLTGAHTTIANNCVECHANGYNNTPNTCVGCHQSDFNTSGNPNHPAIGISTDCATCHTTAPGWSPATFANHNDYYLITGAHTAIAADCAACHNGNYNNTPNTCVGCHAADFNNTTDPDHEAQQFPTDCISCHSQSAWAPSTFNHNTVYPLIGAHAAIANNCVVCHNGNYTNTPNTCIGCHTADFNNTTNPDHEVAMFPTDCTTCHSQSAWTPSTFNHSTIYPLTGAHATIANNCVECHANGYNNTPNTCVGCHQSDFNTSGNPNHPAIGISTDCATCHTTAPGWSPATFANHNDYYLITGAHTAIAADCVACHNGNYNNTPNTCIGCHTADFNNTTNPDHEVAMFPTDCTTCHSQSAWAPSTFNHSTIYPLTGAHASIAANCVECHANGYNNTPNTCVGCHQSDFNTSGNPNHPAIGISTDCATCHTTAPGWSPATFANHNDYYLITGAHTAIAGDCAACHNGNYNNTPNTCVGCHASDFNNTNDPDHEAQQFPTDCISCHSQSAWAPSAFNHNTVYPLIGAHAVIANNCVVCHNGNYTNTPNTCIGCHIADFNNTTNPDHEVAMFPTDCTTCHSQSAWTPSTFNHSTIYPLTGAHASIAANCIECHANGYNNTPNTCVGCHQSDFNTSGNPNHPAIGISTDCVSCHTTAPGWSPATFANHNDYYLITGAHTAIAGDCAACHNGNYNNTPNTCVGCHQSDYNGTTNPDHADAQFSTDCTSCHTQSAWTPSTFNHNNFYPLIGAHAAIANNCVVCHNGNYTNTPNTCFGCHASDYNSATNPNHQTAQFPTDCTACHSQSAWEPSTFDHDGMYFPIYSGTHNNEWDQCIECHINPNNYSIFSCIDCHEHDNQNEVNNDHDEVNGYQYNSNACFACHPDGND